MPSSEVMPWASLIRRRPETAGCYANFSNYWFVWEHQIMLIFWRSTCRFVFFNLRDVFLKTYELLFYTLIFNMLIPCCFSLQHLPGIPIAAKCALNLMKGWRFRWSTHQKNMVFQVRWVCWLMKKIIIFFKGPILIRLNHFVHIRRSYLNISFWYGTPIMSLSVSCSFEMLILHH